MTITNNYIFHRQQLKKQRPEFFIKTKYRREDVGEEQSTYDWEAHYEVVKRKNPYSYVENK